MSNDSDARTAISQLTVLLAQMFQEAVTGPKTEGYGQDLARQLLQRAIAEETGFATVGYVVLAGRLYPGISLKHVTDYMHVYVELLELGHNEYLAEQQQEAEDEDNVH